MGIEKMFDAVIVGAGAAGASCAVWLARLGFAPVVVDAAQQVGGLCLLNPFVDDWNVSLPGTTGPQVADNLVHNLAEAKVPVVLSYPVVHAGHDAEGFVVSAHAQVNSAVIRARYLVLATGVTARGLPQVDQAAPGVLVGPGPHIVAQDFQGRRVAVLGGGDNAFENALYAMRRGALQVQVYARTIRAQQQLVRQVPDGCVALGPYEVDALAKTVNGQPFDVILVFYGWEPSTPFARGLHLQRTHEGFVATDWRTAETSHRGVYAIGEVAQRQHPCIVTAMADGVTAAKAIQARIEARLA
jgi:thioredoxin reductase